MEFVQGRMSMTNPETESIAEQFRQHRHDVLNELQLVRGYIQMGQTERALTIVDRAARWLQSLAMWQSNTGELGEQLMWVASICPHLVVQRVELDVPLTDAETSMLSAWLRQAEIDVSEVGQRLSLRAHLCATGWEIACDAQPAVLEGWQSTFRDIVFSGFSLSDDV